MPEQTESVGLPAAVPPGEWRGGGRAADEGPRHNWQREEADLPLGPSRLRAGWRRLRIGGMLAALVVLLGLFVYYLLFSPVQTPLVAVVATAYEPPFAPNAWAREDLGRLTALHDATLHVTDASAAWTSAEQGLSELGRLVGRAVHQSRSRAVIVYLSLHGAADERGTPCLIPPGASPIESDTWLPMRRVIETVMQLAPPGRANVLLVLDAGRMRESHAAGLFDNGFAEGLRRLVRSMRDENTWPPNLYVLNSTSPGETGWASRSLHGTAFGQAFRLGLAGEADRTAEGGDDDRRVSLSELHRYVVRHVGRWARRHRPQSQTPMLLPDRAGDFAVAWAMNEAARAPLFEPPPPATVPVPDIEIAGFWKDYRDAAPLVQSDPLAWHRLSQKLLWLEQCVAAGSGYEAEAVRTAQQLATLHEELRRDRAASWPRPLRTQAEREAGLAEIPRGMLSLHTGPLIDWFRRATLWADGPRGASPTGVALSAPQSEADAPPLLERDHFLQVVRRYGVDTDPRGAARRDALLALRATAEQLAVPADERVHRWTAPLVARGDAARRIAEDLLLAGPSVPDAQWQAAHDEADQWYVRAEEWQDEVSDALATRDRAWAEIAYFAQWMARPAADAEAAQKADRDLAAFFLPLVDSLRMLDTALDRPQQAEPTAGPESLPFVRPRDEVMKRLKELHRLLTATYAGLLDPRSRGAADRQEMTALLAVPLLPDRNEDLGLGPVEQRMRLRARRAEGDAALIAEASLPAAGATEGEPAVLSQQSRMAERWTTHPALVVLTAATDAPPMPLLAELAQAFQAPDKPDPFLYVAGLGGRMRSTLRALPLQMRTTRDHAPATADGWRQALSLNERRTRAAAAFAFGPMPRDPVGDLRRLDCQQLLAWHARRALDDFWGPARPDGPSLYAGLAEDYLRTAEALDDMSPVLPHAEREIAARMVDCRRAARQGLRTLADNVLLIDRDDDITVRAAVGPGQDGAVSGLPDGRAVVLLRGESGRVPGAARPVPVADIRALAADALSEVRFTLPGAALARRDADLQAVALFRGHEFAAPFRLSVAGGVEVVHQPQVYDAARILVNEGRRKQAEIVFVLDCSGSMDQKVPREGSRVPTTRLAAATDALQQMLDQLARQRDVRVGVLFYGHRVGYSTQVRNLKQLQTDYQKVRPFAETLEPYEDVEAVLPLGRFGPEQAGFVAALMGELMPWGQTPLYRAMIEGLQEFDEGETDTERVLVVITDGLNYVDNPPVAQQRSVSHVTQAWRRQPARIHIVGFGISDREQDQAQQEFSRLAKQTGGDYVAVSAATTLLASLQRLISPSVYRVESQTGDSYQEEVRTPVMIDGLDSGRQSFRVVLDDVTGKVELTGGEALELVVGRDGQGFEVVPYEHNGPRFAPLVTGVVQEPTGYVLGAHSPIQRTDGVEFEFSVQHAERQFTRRPEEIWIEITPVLADGRGVEHRYLFYDAAFVPGTTVPVVKCLARDWPPAARQAEIRFWCKQQPTEPTHAIPARDLSDRLSDDGALPELPGVVYQVKSPSDGAARLVVIERHTAASSGIGAVKVDLHSPVLPRRVVRRFDAVHHVAVHTFEFDPADAPALESCELRFTRRADLHAGAWHLARPLVVPIGGTGDVIPLGITASP